MTETISQQAIVPDHLHSQRLDKVAAELFPDFSRSRIQSWIKAGQLTVNGQQCKPREHLKGGETLTIEAELEPEIHASPEEIPIDIVYEDDSLLVINKPAGLVVHPAVGNRSGTLLNALLHHQPSLENLPRCGIVHRIDKDTTGLLVIAKTLQAHHHLVRQLQKKTMGREYQAVVIGELTGGSKVEAKIGRHPNQRVKMAVTEHGKPAVTHYRLLKRFRGHTHIKLMLETGRTHQIRVHMAYVGYPLVGDPTYGGRPRLPKGASQELIEAVSQFRRQALHAFSLTLEHPVTGETMSWQAKLPEDFQQLLQALELDKTKM